MTTDERISLEQTIALGIKQAATLTAAIAPQFAAFALIGQAVAALEPKLVESVVAMIQKKEPTDAEEQELASLIESLFKPEDL